MGQPTGNVTTVRFFATGVAAGATGVETLITLKRQGGLDVLSSGNSLIITSGKTLRITSIVFATRGHATATAQVTTFSLRINPAGATTVSSPISLQARCATPATSSAWDRFSVPVPHEGIAELSGDGTLTFGVSASAVFTTNAPTWDVFITGVEY